MGELERDYSIKTYFRRFGRHAHFMVSGLKFAVQLDEAPYPYCCIQHQTPLHRNLPGAERILPRNKEANLKSALKRLDGVSIHPGETFSFWKVLGKPVWRRGFHDSQMPKDGRVTKGMGGGLGQLSNLIYWMSLHTGLTVKERYRHGYDLFPDKGRVQPFGSGATCVYNFRDLVLYNDTARPYQLRLRIHEGQLEGEWRSTLPEPCVYQVYEREHSIYQDEQGQYRRKNVICRRMLSRSNAILNDEIVSENDAVMCYQPSTENL